jgi:hypothetical protein
MPLFRQLKEIFGALSEIAVVFASHGRGLMPPDVNRLVETKYELHRENYNSSLVHGVCFILFSPSKSLTALDFRKIKDHKLPNGQIRKMPVCRLLRSKRENFDFL